MIRRSRLVPYITTIALIAICVFCIASRAQSTVDGAIDGHIMDSSGAMLPNVKVVVTNRSTNAQSNASTDGSGYYRATRLQPGDYALTYSIILPLRLRENSSFNW